MKFRSKAASIALYFLFILLATALFTHATKDESKTIISVLENFLTQDVHQPAVKTVKLLHSISKHIISNILNQFLTIHEILILRTTCKVYLTILLPNDENMVMFCKDFHSKEMEQVPLIWFDLKYFLNQSYSNALNKMEIFNIKKNTYVAFTSKDNEKIIIAWYNTETAYPKILFDKTKKELISKNNNEVEQPSTICNKLCRITRRSKITNKENIITGGTVYKGDCFDYVDFKSQNVKSIFTTSNVFAARFEDGTIVAWGEYSGETIPLEIQTRLRSVTMIFSSNNAFAAVLPDRHHVISWGDYLKRGKVGQDISPKLLNVKTFFSTQSSFAALLDDGRVIAWGKETDGGKIPDAIHTELQNVKMIFFTNHAFCALLKDGRVVAWGDKNYGGQIPIGIQIQLLNVKMIFSTDAAFATLLEDGTVFAWGSQACGGIIPQINPIKIDDKLPPKLMNVATIFPQRYAFTALYINGDILTWP